MQKDSTDQQPGARAPHEICVDVAEADRTPVNRTQTIACLNLDPGDED